jgi:hypothetical protein
MLHDIWRELVFLGGRIRRTKTIPWFTWKEHRPFVSYEEIMASLRDLQTGDIGLHLEWGAFSNLAIPGFMKHAWIQTNASHSLDRQRIVEATQEGVLEKHPLVPMRSDYVIIVRPRYVDEQDRVRAVQKARKICGCKYDVDFKFDIEEELEELKIHKNNMKRFDKAFSCTETVSFSWWHCHEQLRLFRTRHRGKEVILGDSFLRRTFEIVWASDSVTTDVAEAYGLHDEGLGMIEEYKAKQALKGCIDNSAS